MPLYPSTKILLLFPSEGFFFNFLLHRKLRNMLCEISRLIKQTVLRSVVGFLEDCLQLRRLYSFFFFFLTLIMNNFHKVESSQGDFNQSWMVLGWRQHETLCCVWRALGSICLHSGHPFGCIAHVERKAHLEEKDELSIAAEGSYGRRVSAL